MAGAQQLPGESQSESNHLFEQIRQLYQRNSRIERIMNPAKSFPIEESYINLTIVKAKEQLENEMQPDNPFYYHSIHDPFEDIYNMKTTINVENIFKTSKTNEKQVFLFGQAGIGKSTFCRYVAYQWATNSYWPQYELVALISLCRFTTNHYPPLPLGQSYSLIDLLKKEVFHDDVSEEDERILIKQFDANKTLWILDGYDDIAQNVPPHLKYLWEQLLKTPHHILTSRSYSNTLSYDVQMEITGFTDKNIEEYVKQFFNQIKDELDDTTIKTQKLLSFLKSNSSIQVFAHIPINLELICSLWGSEDWSEAKELTITILYSMMTEWLCRRYLTAQNIPIQEIPKNQVYQYHQKELAFLENVAFNAMESNTIIIRRPLLERALDDAKVSLQNHQHIINIGILKSFDKHGTGTQIETDKDYYFVHLSFQEYFAARYLTNALKGSATEKAIEFIKCEKYNQHFALVFTFMSGLISGSNEKPCLELFWNNVLREPLELTGIRHMQLVISCIEETSNRTTLPRYTELLEWIEQCIKHSFSTESKIIRAHLSQSLQRAQSVARHQAITKILINLLQSNDTDTKATVLSFVSNLKIVNPSIELITLVITRIADETPMVAYYACQALRNMCKKAATVEMINILINALEDKNHIVRENARRALVKIGENAGSNEVINGLVNEFQDMNDEVKQNVCQFLGEIGEKAATPKVINTLVNALGDPNSNIREKVCKALGSIGEKACKTFGSIGENEETTKVINALVIALRDTDDTVKWNACKALGSIGEKAESGEVINALVNVLRDRDPHVRMNACIALGKIGERAATREAIDGLVNALRDENSSVRENACEALGKMGEKAEAVEVISGLIIKLGDTNDDVRKSACRALVKIGENAGSNEVINGLVNEFQDMNDEVKQNVCQVLGEIGEKAATPKVINTLVDALGDPNSNTREKVCKALGTIGEKACKTFGSIGENEETTKVIKGLLIALQNTNPSVRKNACEALGSIGEKAESGEMINALVNVLRDRDPHIRENACKALGKIGERAATRKVINGLVNAFEDSYYDVKQNACEALARIHEKVITTDVIEALVSALGNTNIRVKQYACVTLGKIGERAATREVIDGLVNALRDKNSNVRENACEALGKMGEKAEAVEVISGLIIKLGDTNKACQALVKIGENARSNEVINGLVNEFQDMNDEVKQNVCRILGEIGEKAATPKVINTLVNALGDPNSNIREKVCKALGSIGEKACKTFGSIGENEETTKVINALVIALRDTDDTVKWNACKALGKIGERAGTKEVIEELVNTLVDTAYGVRESACEALGNIGEKAATSEVLKGLVNALGDWNGEVNHSARKALRSIGGETATDKVIKVLVNALGDSNDAVRSAASEVLGGVDVKVATEDVINSLVTVLVDENGMVRWSVFKALEKIGVEVATNELINKLLSKLVDKDWNTTPRPRDAVERGDEIGDNEDVTVRAMHDFSENRNLYIDDISMALKRYLRSFLAMRELHSDTIQKLYYWISRLTLYDLRAVPMEQFIKVFLDTKNCVWLPVVATVALIQGTAVCVIQNAVLVYGDTECVELHVSSEKLLQELVNAFRNQAERLHLSCDMLFKDEVTPKIEKSEDIVKLRLNQDDQTTSNVQLSTDLNNDDLMSNKAYIIKCALGFQLTKENDDCRDDSFARLMVLHVFGLDIRDVAEEINRLTEISWPNKRINKALIISLLRSAEEDYGEKYDNTSKTASAQCKNDEWSMEDDMAAVYALENFDLALVDLRNYFHYDDRLLRILQCGADECEPSQTCDSSSDSTEDPTYCNKKHWKEVRNNEGAEHALQRHHNNPDGWEVTTVGNTGTKIARLGFGKKNKGRIAAVPNDNNIERVLVHVGNHNSYETYRNKAHKGVISAFNGSDEKRQRNDLTLFEWLKEGSGVFDVSTRFLE